jgi:hypothetical protein
MLRTECVFGNALCHATYDPLEYVALLTYSLLATCLLIFFPVPRPSCLFLVARPQCCFPGGDGDNAPLLLTNRSSGAST